MYKVLVKKAALKELEEIPKIFRLQIIDKIDELANNPRPSGVKKLENSRNGYRVRVGNYRVIYHIQDFELLIDIVKIAHRKEVYRNK